MLHRQHVPDRLGVVVEQHSNCVDLLAEGLCQCAITSAAHVVDRVTLGRELPTRSPCQGVVADQNQGHVLIVDLGYSTLPKKSWKRLVCGFASNSRGSPISATTPASMNARISPASRANPIS